MITKLHRLKGTLDILRKDCYKNLHVDEMEPFEIRESPVPDYCLYQVSFLLSSQKGDIDARFIKYDLDLSLVAILKSLIQMQDLKMQTNNLVDVIKKEIKPKAVTQLSYPFVEDSHFNNSIVKFKKRFSSKYLESILESLEKNFKSSDISADYSPVPFSSFNSWNLHSSRYNLDKF